jgi:pilus assembly protein CpaB
MKFRWTEKFRFNKNLMVPVVALVLGTVAALFANSYIKSTIADAAPRALVGQMVDAVVPKANLMKGTKLDTSNLSIRKVPAEWMHSNAVTPAQFAQIKGLELVLPAKEGEQLLWTQIEGKKAPTFSARLATGRRAVTVSVDEISSISGLVSPGDTIDMVASVKSDNRSVMVPVLQAVHVIATGTRLEQAPAEAGGGQRSYTTVTLDVTPQEARRIMAAREVGRISALLRAPGDRQNTMSGLIDARVELGLDANKGTETLQATVPVLTGGGDPRRYAVGGGAIPVDVQTARVALMSTLADLTPRQTSSHDGVARVPMEGRASKRVDVPVSR